MVKLRSELGADDTGQYRKKCFNVLARISRGLLPNGDERVFRVGPRKWQHAHRAYRPDTSCTNLALALGFLLGLAVPTLLHRPRL